MKKTLVGLTAALTSCFTFALCACGGEDPAKPKTPEKLKDGDAISLVVGGTKNTDLGEYISIAGTKAVYSIESANEQVVTAAVEDSTAEFTAVSRGMTTVTASAGDVSVEFAVTVYGKAAAFDSGSISYDLRTADSGALTLAPKADSGEDTYSYTYSLKAADAHATISDNVLTVNYDEPTSTTLTVMASYTDGALPGAAALRRSSM